MRLRSTIDLLSFGFAAKRAENFHTSQDAQYGKVAITLARQVERGLNPLAAEAELNATLTAQAEAYPELTPKAEKTALALARLVENEVIDPILAENMLDTGFSPFSVLRGVNSPRPYDDLLA